MTKERTEEIEFGAEFFALLRNPKTKKAAFSQLVAAYSRSLYWQIRRIVLQHDRADELVQETFLKAWRAIDNFRGESRLYTWFYRIAIHEALNYVGKVKRRNENSIEITDENQYLVDNIAGDIYFDGDAVETLFQKAINTLPPKQKQVFLLRYYDELPYADIAEMTGTSEGSLKASYHHAVNKIKAIIEASN